MTTIQPNKRFFPRAAMTLLVMVLATMTAWAQYSPLYLSLEKNDGSGTATAIPVSYDFISGKYSYKLSSTFFTREGYTIMAWSTLPTVGTQYGANATIELETSMTLYAVWDDMPYVGKNVTQGDLTYQITCISPNTVKVKMYDCESPIDLLIPSSVTIEGSDFSVTSIAELACGLGSKAIDVSIPASVTSIEGGAFYYCEISGTVTIAGNPYITASSFPAGTTVNLNLTANAADGAKWTTFYNDGCNFRADANTTVYKGTVSGSSLVLHEVEDRIVNRGTAVILKSTGDPVMTWVMTSSTDTHGNDLRGNAGRRHRTDILTGSLAGGTLYVMGKVGDEFGFFEYTGEFMPAGKAYIALPPAEAPVRGLSMEENDSETTSIRHSQFIIHNEADAWHTLDGRRLNGMPTAKGVYVVNGKKVIIK